MAKSDEDLKFLVVLGEYTNEVLLGRFHVWGLRQLSIALCKGLDGSLWIICWKLSPQACLVSTSPNMVLFFLFCSALS